MACGDKYAHLVPSKPDLGGWRLGWSMYGERKAAADRLLHMVAARRADAQGKGVAEPLEGRWSNYAAAHDDLPSSTFLDPRPDEQLIALAQASAEEGACVLELYDGVLGTPANVPAPGAPPPAGFLGGELNLPTVAALATVAWIAWQMLRAK